MHRSERLAPVHGLAADAERKAAAELAAGETRVAEAEHTLAELERYADEYRATLQRRTADGIDAARLRAFHAFVGRLGDAVVQQQAAAQRARDERDLLRARWADRRRRARAVGKAIEQASREERLQRDRREQSDVDERAQRVFAAAQRASRGEQ